MILSLNLLLHFGKEVQINLTLVYYLSRGCIEWPAFEWIHVDCFPDLIQLACFLPQKEDNLRNRLTKVPYHYLCHSLVFNFVFGALPSFSNLLFSLSLFFFFFFFF